MGVSACLLAGCIYSSLKQQTGIAYIPRYLGRCNGNEVQEMECLYLYLYLFKLKVPT